VASASAIVIAHTLTPHAEAIVNGS
jgi:hypothetical protein